MPATQFFRRPPFELNLQGHHVCEQRTHQPLCFITVGRLQPLVLPIFDGENFNSSNALCLYIHTQIALANSEQVDISLRQI